MIARWLKPWADAALRDEVAELQRQLAEVQAKLETERRTVSIRDAEIEQLGEVIARDRCNER